jgi:hypothetical protein
MYKIVESRLSKSMFYDPSWSNVFIIFIAPFAYFVLNMILFFILNLKDYLYLSFVPFLIPLIYLIFKSIKQRSDNKKYTLLLNTIQPIVIKLLKEHNLDISIDDIHLVYYRQFNEKHLDIRISLPMYNKETIDIGKRIERIINNEKVTSDVITKVLFEKKSKLILDFQF